MKLETSMLVCDIMTTEPCCVAASDTMQTAAALMRQWDTGFLPVVDSQEQRRLVGVITNRDLCCKVVAGGGDAARVLVSECMTQGAIRCDARDHVRQALDLMRVHHVRRLVATCVEGEVLGIISLADIIRYAALSETELVAALVHIFEPVGEIGRQIARAETVITK